MLLAHLDLGLDCVFRLQRNANAAFDAFIESGATESAIDLDPPRDAPRTGSRRVRLLKYVAGDTEFRLATTLLDAERFPAPALADPCHDRWQIEELRKSAKDLMGESGARSENGVRQELYAASALISPARVSAGRGEAEANAGGDGIVRANFRSGTGAVGREIEKLFLVQTAVVAEAASRIMDAISRSLLRERRGRSYPRASKKPSGRWQRRRAA